MEENIVEISLLDLFSFKCFAVVHSSLKSDFSLDHPFSSLNKIMD